MTAATDCPPCPECKLPSVCGPGPTDLVCGGCGLLWTGTPEQRAQAEQADAAYEAELTFEEQCARDVAQNARDRHRAIALFEAAGKPVPEWLRGGDV